MANHPSAEKRAKQNIKRRDRNRAGRAANRTAVKKVTNAIADGSIATTAVATLSTISAQLAGSAAKGIIPKKRAARKIGRLAKQLHAAKQA